MYLSKVTGGLVAVLLGSTVCSMPAEAEMQGDAEAIALAEQLVESIGGAEVWSKINTLYIVEKSRTPVVGDGLIGTFWRDLNTPRATYTIQNDNVTYQKTWAAEGGWRVLRGDLKMFSKEEIAISDLTYWPGEIYVLYHRFALEDETLRLEVGEDTGQFTVFNNESGDRLGDFWLNVDGDMYRWRHDDGTEYIYGPHKQFGDISLPDWGTQVDGSWSFYYVEVRGYEGDIPVSFDPPEGK